MTKILAYCENFTTYDFRIENSWPVSIWPKTILLVKNNNPSKITYRLYYFDNFQERIKYLHGLNI
jgi:hypothetical protein